jgi:hypothetical protein
MEKRNTRNKGVNPKDKQVYRKIVEGLRLRKNHSISDEVNLREEFLLKCRELEDCCVSNCFVSSAHALFYTKFVTNKNLKQSRKESALKVNFSPGTTATPSTAAKAMRKLAKLHRKPVVCFFGQDLDFSAHSFAHCWGFTLWLEDGIWKGSVKDSNGHLSGAKVSNHARFMGKILGFKTIELVPASAEERCSDDDCLLLTYYSIADVLDGRRTEDKENVKIYDVTSKKFLN